MRVKWKSLIKTHMCPFLFLPKILCHIMVRWLRTFGFLSGLIKMELIISRPVTNCRTKDLKFLLFFSSVRKSHNQSTVMMWWWVFVFWKMYFLLSNSIASQEQIPSFCAANEMGNSRRGLYITYTACHENNNPHILCWYDSDLAMINASRGIWFKCHLFLRLFDSESFEIIYIPRAGHKLLRLSNSFLRMWSIIREWSVSLNWFYFLRIMTLWGHLINNGLPSPCLAIIQYQTVYSMFTVQCHRSSVRVLWSAHASSNT